jgi:hypothetical protein
VPPAPCRAGASGFCLEEREPDVDPRTTAKTTAANKISDPTAATRLRRTRR